MGVFFSVIVPFGKESDYIEECVQKCLAQSFKSLEVIVLPDSGWSPGRPSKKLSVFPTGKKGPAEKRDIGAGKASGKFLAFIDDDVFPSKDWLLNAKKQIDAKKAKAVCGPAVLASKGPFAQRLSALFYSSRAGSGSLSFRYVPKSGREVDDYPSSNLIIEKSAFIKAGGFDSKYYPGEDTVLCQKLSEAGCRIFYSPGIIVNHYARPSFEKHFIQVFGYGLHRGFFLKKFLKNSLRLNYFAPLAPLGFFVIVILSLLLAVREPVYWIALALMFAFYYILVFVTANSGLVLRLFAPFFFFATHAMYGAGFVIGFSKGLIGMDLKR